MVELLRTVPNTGGESGVPPAADDESLVLALRAMVLGVLPFMLLSCSALLSLLSDWTMLLFSSLPEFSMDAFPSGLSTVRRFLDGCKTFLPFEHALYSMVVIVS